MAGSGKDLVPAGATPVKKMGRPKGSSAYGPEIEDEIIERLTLGQTLISICAKDRNGNLRFEKEFPNHSTVSDWADPKDPACRPHFVPRYARARLAQQRFWIEECKDIADTPMPGVEEIREHSSKGGISIRRATKDMLHHRMLQISTRLDMLARLNPQVYSERLQQPALPTDQAQGAEPPKLIIEGGFPDERPIPPRPDYMGPDEPPPAPKDGE